MKVGLFPGTFDPITNGHLKIIDKASKLFDKLYVCILHNPDKEELFSLNDRLEMINLSIKDYKNIEATSYDGLTIDAAKKYNATYIVRGIRNTEDLKFEIVLNASYKELDPNIEIIYFLSDEKEKKISSTMVRDLIDKNIYDIKKYVPNEVYNKILNIYKKD